MRGLHGITKKQQPQKLAQGGMVRGPGTGTSDSIQAEVPAGSYIMPADSTQKLGVGGLKGLGKSVPVNLSNGEYQLPPEQVHAVGVQALDQMKAATHTPVSPDQVQGQGLGLKPPMFFADGGPVYYVDDDGEASNRLRPRDAAAASRTIVTDSAGTAQVRNMPAVQQPYVQRMQAAPQVNSRPAYSLPSPEPTPRLPAPEQPQPQTRTNFYVDERGGAARGLGAAQIDGKPSYYVDSSGSASKGLPYRDAAASRVFSVDQSGSARISNIPATQGERGLARISSAYSGSGGTGSPASEFGLRHTGQQALPAPEPSSSQGRAPTEAEYRARAETMARAKADSAAWQADREATASQYRPASGEPPVPKPAVAPVEPPKKPGGLTGLGRAALAGLSGVSEGVTAYENTAKVAADPRSSSYDVNFEAGRGASRTAGAIAGSLGGARLGGMAGPVGAVVGGIAGGALGAWAPGLLIDGAHALGVPRPNITAETAQVAQQQQPQQQQAPQASGALKPSVTTAQPQATQSTAPVPTGQKDSAWSQTGIGEGLSQIVGRVGKNGVPEFTNDPTAIQGAAAKPTTGIAGVGDGIGGGIVAGQPGDAQRAIEQYGRANEIYREMNQMRRGQELGDNGNQLVVVRDSSRAPTTAELMNARLDAAQSQRDMAQQELGLRRAQLNSEQQSVAKGLGFKARELEMAESSAQLGNQRTQQEIDAGGLALTQQRQIQSLRDRILSSTDQRERSTLTEQLSALLGREATPNRFTVVPGGQEFDPASSMVVNRPARVINNQTGQWVDQKGATANSGMTLVGHSNGKPVYKDANGKTYIDN